MNYKAVIIDLDGTLLNSKEVISSVNKKAIQYALANGYKVTLASGRPHTLMMHYVEQLQLTESIICCNGAYIYNPLTNKKTMEQVIPTDQVFDLIDLLVRLDFNFTLYADQGIFAQKESKHTLSLERKAKKMQLDLFVQVIPTMDKLIKKAGNIYKILVSSEDKKSLCTLRNSLNTKFQVDLSTPHKLDITACLATKGGAAKNWLQEQNLCSYKVVAFGDGDNDKSLFQLVGEPIAMANASPSLKGIANLIITDNNGCGIGQYLRSMVKEGLHTSQTILSH